MIYPGWKRIYTVEEISIPNIVIFCKEESHPLKARSYNDKFIPSFYPNLCYYIPLWSTTKLVRLFYE